MFQKNIVAFWSCLLLMFVWVSHRLLWKHSTNKSQNIIYVCLYTYLPDQLCHQNLPPITVFLNDPTIHLFHFLASAPGIPCWIISSRSSAATRSNRTGDVGVQGFLEKFWTCEEGASWYDLSHFQWDKLFFQEGFQPKKNLTKIFHICYKMINAYKYVYISQKIYIHFSSKHQQIVGRYY